VELTIQYDWYQVMFANQNKSIASLLGFRDDVPTGDSLAFEPTTFSATFARKVSRADSFGFRVQGSGFRVKPRRIDPHVLSSAQEPQLSLLCCDAAFTLKASERACGSEHSLSCLR
jgi:hypothetical protein